MVSWTWQCYTSASFCGQSKSHGQSRFKGWGIVFVLSQRVWGEGRWEDWGRFGIISPEAACCRERTRVHALLLLLAVQIWAGKVKPQSQLLITCMLRIKPP